MGNQIDNKKNPIKEAELPSGKLTKEGGEFNAGKIATYPIHSRPCKSCGEPIELRSESQPDYQFNCTQCAYHIRKEDLRYEDDNEKSPRKEDVRDEDDNEKSFRKEDLRDKDDNEKRFRKEDLRDEDNEKSPPKQATCTENKRTKSLQNEKKIWRETGHFEEFRLIRNILQGNGDGTLKDLFNNITSDLLHGKTGSVFGEIAFLSQNKRSCLVQVKNQTSYIISCFGKAILGKQEHTHDNKIQPEQRKSYFFKKSNFSLKGCAGILTFTVKISEGSTLCFLVAFRNYTVQIREESYNKVAILRINDSEIKPDLGVPFFSKLMEIKESCSCPSFDKCCYVSNACTFKATIASKQPNIEIQYDNIEIKVSMTHYHQSQVFITVTSKKEITSGEH